MKPSALTLRSNGGILNALKSQVLLTSVFIEGEKPKEIVIMGIWDTGATNSVITRKAVEALDLKPISRTVVSTANGECEANVYLVNIVLPSNVAIQAVRVTEGKLGNDDEMLIGMDIITLGDLSITNLNGNTVMTFRTPSCNEVDYVKDIEIKVEKDRRQQGLNTYSPSKTSKKKRQRAKR